MASRMESTGVRGRIQLSDATAKLLIKAGKGHWIEERREHVDVKGKGRQTTYFLKRERGETTSSSGKAQSTTQTTPLSTDGNDLLDLSAHRMVGAQTVSRKSARLIDWNTEVLSRRINAVIQHRQPDVDVEGNDDVGLGPVEMKQLRRYVHHIASLYRESNPFHNYEHASHVMLSIEKMLSRVQVNSGLEMSSGYTNDIRSDPLAQFAVVFAALIHDVDHSGVSNATLVKEQDPVAIQYDGKSPAEHHSFDLAWDLLLEDEFKSLVDSICGESLSELDRFKQLLFDAVMATDVFDPKLIQSRNMQWEQVFSQSDVSKPPVKDAREIDLMKAKIVLEHLIQASDVAHTMQVS
jgi:hypothetical protein